MSYYNKITKTAGDYDVNYIVESICYFQKELDDARTEIKIVGNIQRNCSTIPGIVEYRFAQLQEIKSIIEYLKIILDKVKGTTFKKYNENYNKDLSSKDIDKYVLAESEVQDLAIIINDFSFLENRYIGILKGLDCKQFQLTNIVKLKIAGMDEFEII